MGTDVLLLLFTTFIDILSLNYNNNIEHMTKTCIINSCKLRSARASVKLISVQTMYFLHVMSVARLVGHSLRLKVTEKTTEIPVNLLGCQWCGCATYTSHVVVGFDVTFKRGLGCSLLWRRSTFYYTWHTTTFAKLTHSRRRLPPVLEWHRMSPGRTIRSKKRNGKLNDIDSFNIMWNYIICDVISLAHPRTHKSSRCGFVCHSEYPQFDVLHPPTTNCIEPNGTPLA